MTWLAAIGLGFLMGVRHAVEPDHLAAVTALANRAQGMVSAARSGAIWGLGHSIGLLGVGLVILLFRWQVPESVLEYLELPVGIMLIILGVLVLRDLKRSHVHLHVHRLGWRFHIPSA